MSLKSNLSLLDTQILTIKMRDRKINYIPYAGMYCEVLRVFSSFVCYQLLMTKCTFCIKNQKI